MRRSLRSLFSPPAAFAVLTSARLASAQHAKQDEFSAQRFQPAPGPHNYLTVEGARTDGIMAISVGAFVNYSDSPFVVRSCISATNCDAPNAQQRTDIKVINSMVTGDLLGSLTPVPRVQLGMRVPVTYVKGDGFDPSTGFATQGGLSKTGLGDPMLEAKFRALGAPSDPLVLGAAVFASAPLGHATAKDAYIGDASPLVGVRGIVDVTHGPLSAAGNLAAVYRGDARLGSTTQGSELRYGAAAAFAISPLVRVLAEVFGATRFSARSGSSALEVDAGAQVSPLDGRLTLSLGGGAGVVQGIGVPSFRGIVGVGYATSTGDQDHDGVPDAEDKCPQDAEDRDGFQDDDGCPDPDNDNDGIPDAADKCPDRAETMNGIDDTDGCPDEIPDRDHDGIADADDKCPDAGGPTIIAAVGSQYRGCPDSDRDGVPDYLDKCPDEPEDTDGFQDEDGCPDPDNDGDGVPDTLDECPAEAGPGTANGCPAAVPDKARKKR